MNMGDIWGASDLKEEPAVKRVTELDAAITPIKEAVMWIHHRIVVINEMTDNEFTAEHMREHLRLTLDSYKAICNLDHAWFEDIRRSTKLMIMKHTYKVLAGMRIEDQIEMLRKMRKL